MAEPYSTYSPKRRLSEMKKIEALKCLQILAPQLFRDGIESAAPYWKIHPYSEFGIKGAGFYLKNPANDYYLDVDEPECEVCLMNPNEGDALERCNTYLYRAKALIEYLEAIGFKIQSPG